MLSLLLPLATSASSRLSPSDVAGAFVALVAVFVVALAFYWLTWQAMQWLISRWERWYLRRRVEDFIELGMTRDEALDHVAIIGNRPRSEIDDRAV